jgi:hypothetical protein
MPTTLLRPALTALCAMSLVGCATGGAMSAAGQRPPTAAPADSLRQSMRRLWSDHVIWTRQYIVAAAQDDPSAQAAAARLLRNQEDIGNAVAVYYGAAAGGRLTELLKQHITIAVDLVAAAKAGNAAGQADADARWHRNAEEIATFLSGANPNWPRQTLLDMLNEHLAMTTREATARLQHRWNDDVTEFDHIHTQALSMADALSNGIIRQYPERF